MKWKNPVHPNGIILRHKVYIYEPSTDYQAPVLKSITAGTVFSTVVGELIPFTLYKVSVKSCNGIGCTQFSYKSSAVTLEAVPRGQNMPHGSSNSSANIYLQWKLPSFLNGPRSSIGFIVERKLPIFSYPPSQVSRGVHFPAFGYYQFSPSMIPESANTRIEFQFRSRYAGGLIFFAASDKQEDMIAVELRDGHPWFIFDTGSGAIAISVITNVKFDDGKWHNVLITRHKREGKIIVDKKYSGMGSVLGDKSVIGPVTSIFIGGLPRGFKINRKDDGRATLKQMPFIGCLKEFHFKGIPIDFGKATNKSDVSPLSDYCPVSHEDTYFGTYFKGGGYIVLKENAFKGGPTFLLKFQLMTSDATSLLFLSMKGATFFAIYLKNQKINFKFMTATKSGTLMGKTKFPCDSRWHDVTVQSSGYELSLYLDSQLEFKSTLPSDIIISTTYLGGVPPGTNEHISQYIDVTESFHGCLQNLVIDTTVYFPHVVEHFHNVDFNGCPLPIVRSCRSGVISSIYNGTDLVIKDDGLSTYTEYLYRVRAYHKHISGFATSPWLSIRSGEGGKWMIFVYIIF